MGHHASGFWLLHEAHGFGWLDDLASVGDQEARMIAQRWVEPGSSGLGAARDLVGRLI